MLGRPVLVLLAVALAASVAAAPVADEAVMAVDDCGIGPHDSDVTLDAHDICEVSMQVVADGDAAPTVSATIRLADASVKGSSLSTAWVIDDCMFQFRLDDDAVDGTGVFLYRPSRLFEGGSADVDIARPSVDGDRVTFTATLEGDLTPYAPLYAPGATLVQRSAFAGPDVPFFTGRSLGSVFVCGVIQGCSYVGGDLVLGGGELTLSAD